LERRAAKEGLMLQLKILPGVVDLLYAAKTNGLRLGVASNSPHSWVDAHLTRLGLFDRFDFIGCREDVASPKPEPDLYRLVLNRFGLRGHEAVAFEDSHTGSLAARRAHVWCVAAPNESTAHHDFSHVDWLVSSLAEVELPALRSRFARP
jgi:HAD superfamily hydrolase (TIGR01509 family)